MAVTQYIGARYVPLFADPIAWDSTREYEPLTIVTHQGNSYTSRQAVPRGIAITNEDFWALTGDYNAQIEQYRQEVQTFDERISENTQNIETQTEIVANNSRRIEEMSVLSYVGNYGAVEKDESVNWTDVISRVAENSDILDFGSGVWYTNQTIVIPKEIKKVVGNCLIVAKAPLTNLIELEYRAYDTVYRPFTFDGLTLESEMINGAPCADTLIWTDSNNINITSCNFRNFRKYGVFASRLGLRVSDCQFMNQSYKCRGIGVHNRTDMFVTDCRFFYCELGVSIRQGWVTNCYFYSETGDEYNNVPISAVGFITPDGEETARALNVVVSNCEFDCINRVFRNLNRATIRDNWFWWNGRNDQYLDKHSIFYNDDDISDWALQDTLFVSNTIGIDKTLRLTDNQPIYMFDNINTVVNYKSYDCDFYNIMDSDGLDHLLKLAVDGTVIHISEFPSPFLLCTSLITVLSSGIFLPMNAPPGLNPNFLKFALNVGRLTNN